MTATFEMSVPGWKSATEAAVRTQGHSPALFVWVRGAHSAHRHEQEPGDELGAGFRPEGGPVAPQHPFGRLDWWVV